MCWCPVFSPRRSPVFMGTDADEFGAYPLLRPLCVMLCCVCVMLCCDVLVVVVVMCCGVVCLLLFATTLHNTRHHTTLLPCGCVWRVWCVRRVFRVCVVHQHTCERSHTQPTETYMQTHTLLHQHRPTDTTQHRTQPPHHVVTVCDAKTRQLEHEKTTNDTEETENRQKTLTWIADGNSNNTNWNMQHKYTDRRDKSRTRERRTTTQQRTGNRGGDKEHSCACICVCFCVFNIVHQTTISNLS